MYSSRLVDVCAQSHLAWERFTETNRRRYTGQRPGTKSASRPVDKPGTNRGSSSPIGLHRVSSVRASKGKPKRSFFPRLGGNGVFFVLGEQSRRRRPVLLVPARPRRPAVRRPVPSRPGYVRVLDSTGHAGHVQERTRCLPAKSGMRVPSTSERTFARTTRMLPSNVSLPSWAKNTLNDVYLSSPKPGHTSGGPVRGGVRRNDGAGRGPAAQDADDGIIRSGENKLFHPQTPNEKKMTS